MAPDAIQSPAHGTNPATIVAPAEPQVEGERPEIVVPGAPSIGDRFFGDLPWRKQLADRGIDALVLATMDLSKVSGGLGSPSIGQALVDLSVTANLDRLGVLPGAEIYTSLQWWDWFGDAPSSIGDYWGWDVINPAIDQTIFQLSELWWQQTAGPWSVMIGKIDAKRVFASIANAGPFLNTADAMPSTLLGYMPTYPNPSMAAVVQWSGLDAAGLRGWSARAGVFDGSNAAYDPATGANGPRTGNRGPSGLFDGHWGPYLIAEGGPGWAVGPSAWAGTLTVGGWWQAGDSLLYLGDAGEVTSNAGGLYATVTHALHAPDDAGGRWDLFAQTGWSTAASVPADFSVSLGAICTAPLPGRTDDQAGVLVGMTSFANDAAVYVNRLGSTGGQETIAEVFYRIALPRGIVLQPDLQWIGTPGGGDGATVDNALIGTIRIEIAF